MLTVVFIVFLIALYLGKSAAEARTLTFVTLVFANLILIITNLSWSKHMVKTLRTTSQTLWWVLFGASLALLLVLYVPNLRNLFHFSFLHWNDLVLTFLAGVIGVVWFEGLKLLNNNTAKI